MPNEAASPTASNIIPPQGTPSAASAPPSSAGGPDLAAALAEATSRAAKLEKALADRDARDKEAASKQAKELEAAGKHQELLDLARKELEAERAAKAALEQDALLGRTYRESAMKKIEAAAKAMPDDARAILDSIKDVDAKSAFVDMFTRQQAAPAAAPGAPAPSPRAPSPTSPAPSSPAIDIAELAKSGMPIAEIKRKHPEAWEAHKRANSPKPVETGAAQWFKRKAG